MSLDLLNCFNFICKVPVFVTDNEEGKTLKRPPSVNFVEGYPVSIGVRFLQTVPEVEDKAG